MTQQAMPFFESAEEATKHAIHASGKAMKQVAAALWPEKSPAAAHTALANALNDNRAERLTFDQHLFIAKYCVQYDVLKYAAHECSHSQPIPQAPEERSAQIQAALFAQLPGIRSMLDQLEALQPKLRAA